MSWKSPIHTVGVKNAATLDCGFQQLAYRLPTYSPDYYLFFKLKSDLWDRKVSNDNEVLQFGNILTPYNF